MKIYKLSLVIFLSLYSCTTLPIQNIIPTTSPSNIEQNVTVANQAENIVTPSIKITPSASIIVSPIPSITSSVISNPRDISSITIIADDNIVISKETFKTNFSVPGSYNFYSYNILPNEKKKFDAYFVESSEIKKQDILWSSSNTDIATVDNNGLVSSINKNSDQELIGFATIKAYIKSNPEISVSFTINLYNKLEVTVKNKDYILCQESHTKVDLPRYQPDPRTEFSSGFRERSTFNGKVYDKNKNLLDGVTITVKSIKEIEDSNSLTWKFDPQITVEGSYVYRNANPCDEILITASKEGYVTKSRRIVLKSNLNGNPNVNTANFGGDNPDDAEFALEKI